MAAQSTLALAPSAESLGMMMFGLTMTMARNIVYTSKNSRWVLSKRQKFLMTLLIAYAD